MRNATIAVAFAAGLGTAAILGAGSGPVDITSALKTGYVADGHLVIVPERVDVDGGAPRISGWTIIGRPCRVVDANKLKAIVANPPAAMFLPDCPEVVLQGQQLAPTEVQAIRRLRRALYDKAGIPVEPQ